MVPQVKPLERFHAAVLATVGDRVAECLSVVLDRTIPAFDPLKILLFGSQARGEARAESDVDLLYVMPDGTDCRQMAIAIRRLLRDVPIAQDIVVTTPNEVARRGKIAGLVLAQALEEGKILYNNCTGELVMGHSDRPVEAGRWLRYAMEDLDVAIAGLKNASIRPRHGCFLAQQAAEKALKAVLIARAIAFPYTHNLTILAQLLPELVRSQVDSLGLEELSDWAVESRYPGELVEPSVAEAQWAIDQAARIVTLARSQF